MSATDTQDARLGAANMANKMARPPRASRDVDLLAYAEEDDSWLLPYVDVVSLLLAFLILALAMSKVNLHRFELLSAALTHKSAPPSLDALKEKIDQMIVSKGLTGQVKTVIDDDGLRMELKNALLFDSGQADITPAGRAAIDRMAALLPTIDDRYQIAIEGHTDDQPIHTVRYDSNWELSAARSISVLKLFTGAGIGAQRLSAQGYADTRPATPIAAGSDPTTLAHARSENRRVLIRIH